MAVIIGRCEHGVIMAAAMENYCDRAELEDMASAYFLERAETVNLGGCCTVCSERYHANIRLLDTPQAVSSSPTPADTKIIDTTQTPHKA